MFHGFRSRVFLTIFPLALGALLLSRSAPTQTAAPQTAPPGLEKIRQFVFIMQENRSFDHYFGNLSWSGGLTAGSVHPEPEWAVRSARRHWSIRAGLTTISTLLPA